MTPKQYLKNVLRTDFKNQNYWQVMTRIEDNHNWNVSNNSEQNVANQILRILHGAIGMCGESGEVIDKVKKTLIYGKELNKKDLLNECGDVLWYMTILLHELGYDLEDAMMANSEKLKKRFPDGFNTKDALERKDEKGLK